ncbi:unnamed protein product [Caenorhabditis nigoni]
MVEASLFHAWENITSSQIATSSEISDYRKAMPCFPGPSLEIPISNEDLLPPYPNCTTFVNISTATIEEVEELIQEIQKQKTVQQMDVSLKSVANSLSNRLQNLVDFLPEGETKRKVEVYHSQLLQMSTHELDNSTSPPIAENYSTPRSYGNPPSFSTPSSYSNPPSYSTSSSYSNPPKPPKFSPLQLLSCFNISMDSLGLLKSLSSQTIGSIGCSKFQICSFSDLSKNSCISHLNITENQYNSMIGKTIGEILKEKLSPGNVFGALFGGISRFKRTPEPDYEEVTPSGNSEDVRSKLKDLEDVRKDKIEKILKGTEEEEGSGDSEDVRNSKFRGNDSSESSGAAPEDVKLSTNSKNPEFRMLKNPEDVAPSGSFKILKSRVNNDSEGSGESPEDVTSSENVKYPEIRRPGSFEDVKLSETLKTSKSRRNEDPEDVTDSGAVVEDVTLPGNSEDVERSKISKFGEIGNSEGSGNTIEDVTTSENSKKLEFRKFKNPEDVTPSGNFKIPNPRLKNNFEGSGESPEDVTLTENSEKLDFRRLEDSVVVTPSRNSKIPKLMEIDNLEGSGEASEDVTPSETLKKPESREDANPEVVTPSLKSEESESRKTEKPEAVTASESSEISKFQGKYNSEDVTSSEISKSSNSKNCGTSGNLVIVDGVTIFICKDSEDVTKPSIQNLEISKFLSEINETVLEDSSKTNFDEALNFFKTQVTSSESSDDVIQNFLNSTLNSTILEYGASFLTESNPDLKKKILEILPNLPKEFTLGQLLKKLGIQNLASVPESLMTFLGSLKETSGSSNSSKSPELSKFVQELPASDSTSKFNLVSDFLEKNPSILANFGF